MGIHNESGHQRLSPAPPLKELIPKLLEMLTSTNDPERSFLPFRGGNKDIVILLVNNLGGLSELELGGIVGQIYKNLDNMGIAIKRVLSGSFMVRYNLTFIFLVVYLADELTDKPEYARLFHHTPTPPRRKRLLSPIFRSDSCPPG